MAGGPFFPNSAVPVTANRVFPNIHIGAGANSKHEEGLGVEASVGADSIWRLRFWMPPTAWVSNYLDGTMLGCLCLVPISFGGKACWVSPAF
jgi:hypothetical protein